MPSLARYIRKFRNGGNTFRRIKMRCHFNADTLYAGIRENFAKVPDHRAGNSSIALPDALMSGFAMFCLKDPSLLAFEKRRQEVPDSLQEVFGIGRVPSDSRMRAILDPLSVRNIRRPFTSIFTQLQRGKGKVLEKMTWLDGNYLLALDGTGIYTSEKMGSGYCLRKRKRSGKEEYYQQMVDGAFVHPELAEVIPTCQEMIVKQDGSTKNDCERNAARRYPDDFRREHPHLKTIVIEDGPASNAPHIREPERHELRYILGVKPKDHEYLYQLVDEAVATGKATDHQQRAAQQEQRGLTAAQLPGILGDG